MGPEASGTVPTDHLAEAMAQVSKKLGLFERVRAVCHSESIPIPGVVVVGDQSSGKSSLLENISGIRFPRSRKTCTKMPCVLTLLSDPTVREPFAEVSVDPSFADATKCCVSDVEEQIKKATAKHVTKKQYITSKALYIRVVRPEGPQLSLIDLPGITHNGKMENIHEVTAGLAEEYIKKEEMVVLCVVPAMSDFGNAEALKLAKKYDPDGSRTLGVVTKCDDAANAEEFDLAEKVGMVRESDVRLALGYHCVVNPSQNDVNEGRSREDHVAKETKVFTESKRMRKIPKENWGIIQLIDKIATLQEVLVDKHLPGIKEKVQDKIDDLEKEMRELPVRLQERAVLFNETTRKIREDLESRIKGESYDRDLAVAPVVAEMVREFKEELLSRNPNWLEQVMIDEVSARQAARQGYTVDNLTGPRSHIFIALIKQTFIESGLLRNWAYSLVTDVGEHLENVVQHVIQRHANVSGISPAVWCEKAKDCIDDLTTQARSDCETLALAQAETSTTCDAYKTQMQWFLHVGNLSKFGEAEACISLGGEYVYLDTLPKEFVHLGQQALHELQKRAVLEICASLQTYTKLMIEGFVETSAKLVKFRLVGQLVDKLEEVWRKELGRSSIEELGAEAESVAERRKHLSKKMKVLSDFEAELRGLFPALLPMQKATFSEKAKVKVKEESSSPAKGTNMKPQCFVWDFAKDVEDETFQEGDSIFSENFSLMGVPNLSLSLILFAPEGWQISYQVTCGDEVQTTDLQTFDDQAWGWLHFDPISDKTTKIAVELLEAVPPQSLEAKETM